MNRGYGYYHLCTPTVCQAVYSWVIYIHEASVGAWIQWQTTNIFPQALRPCKIWWAHYLPDLFYLLLSSPSAALFSPVFLLPQKYAKIIPTSGPLHLLFPLFLSFTSQMWMTLFKCHFLRQIFPGPTFPKLTSLSCPWSYHFVLSL